MLYMNSMLVSGSGCIDCVTSAANPLMLLRIGMISLYERELCREEKQIYRTAIAYALKQAELGTPVEEVCRKMGISDATFYNWKKRTQSSRETS